MPEDKRKPPRKPFNPRDKGQPGKPAQRTAGWDSVAAWYDGWMGRGGSEYHRKVAIPAALKLLDAQRGERILDMGAGQGVLAPFIAEAGAAYTGVDASKRLLTMARKHHQKHGTFIEADAADLRGTGLAEGSFDAVIFLLSIQDMNPLEAVLKSTRWALKPGGRVIILMTHPCFRVPRQSGWGFDEDRKLQYRRVDRYLTPLPVPMKQHSSGVTISFHRPVSMYINGLAEEGMLVDHMDEIAAGDPLERKRSSAEKLADAEIPIFMALRARRV